MTKMPEELWTVVGGLAGVRGWPPRTEKDARRFVEFAREQHLLSLLLADDTLPQSIADLKPRFRALGSLFRRQYELRRDAVLKFQRVVGGENFLLLKGADYSHRLYDKPEQREMTDVDVYVPKSSLDEVMKSLAAAGYSQVYTSYGKGFSPGYYEISFLIDAVHLEIHRSIGQQVRASIDYDGVWDRRQAFERNGVKGFRLSPADMILIHAYNQAKDEFSTELNRYLDFYLMLQLHENELDVCVARAKAWDIERAFFGMLYLTSTLFAGCRTMALSRAIDALLDERTRQFLVRHVLPNPAEERCRHSRGRRVQLWRKFFLIDTSWQRLAFFADHAYCTALGTLRGLQFRTENNLFRTDKLLLNGRTGRGC